MSDVPWTEADLTSEEDVRRGTYSEAHGRELRALAKKLRGPPDSEWFVVSIDGEEWARATDLDQALHYAGEGLVGARPAPAGSSTNEPGPDAKREGTSPSPVPLPLSLRRARGDGGHGG